MYCSLSDKLAYLSRPFLTVMGGGGRGVLNSGTTPAYGPGEHFVHLKKTKLILGFSQDSLRINQFSISNCSNIRLTKCIKSKSKFLISNLTKFEKEINLISNVLTCFARLFAHHEYNDMYL